MHFRSADGYRLAIAPAQLPRLGRALGRSGVFSPAGDLAAQQELLPVLGSLVSESRLRRVYTSTDSGRRYPLFAAAGEGLGFELLTVPLPHSDALSLQMLRPCRPVTETEVRRPGGSVTLTWRAVTPALNVLNPAQGRGNGVYILERGGKPVYVGITLKSFRNRWKDRVQVLQQLGLSTDPLRNDTLWLGTLSGTEGKNFAATLRMVEHALVRYLTKRGPAPYALTNQLLQRPFLPQGAIVITNSEARPGYLRDKIITIDPGLPYELAPAMGRAAGAETESWAHWPT